MRKSSLKVLFMVLIKLYTRRENLETLKVVSIDGTLLPSYRFQDTTGYSGKHRLRGVKLSSVVDAKGVPIAFVFDTGNIHDITLAFDTIDELPMEIHLLSAKALVADMGYDSFLFRLYLKDLGIAPNIKKRPKTHIKQFFNDHFPSDPLIAKKRFVVERFHAWMKSNRRLRIRYDYTLLSFKAFVYLSAIVLCVRQIIA